MNITTKEAIDALKKRISPYTNCAADAEANEVIEKAIKALKQGNVLDKIRAEIEQLHHHPKLDFIKNDEVVDMAIEIIDKYRAESEEKEC